MPIKFECNHCGAKLKIGSRKAGMGTDCPKCDAPIKIPTIAEFEALEAMRNLERSASGLTTEEEDPYLEFTVFDHAETVFDPGAATVHPQSGQNGLDEQISISRRVIFIQGGLLMVVAIVFFLFGMMANSLSRIVSLRTEKKSDGTMFGIVLYQQDNQELVDEGAVVMLLPVDRAPEIRPDASNLRPGVEANERFRDLQIIREIGGGFTEVGPSGRFELPTRVNQEYFLLIISQSKDRESDRRIPKEHRADMGAFFLPVDDLLRQHDYLWRRIDISETKMSIPVVVFE